MEKNDVTALVNNNRVVYTRYFDVPVTLAFKAWSTQYDLEQWWGPDGFTITTIHLNFTVGGYWDFIMYGPDGRDYRNKIQFTEINNPYSLQFRHFGECDGSNDVHFTAKLSFQELGSGTVLTFEQIFPSKEELERIDKKYHAIEGGRQHVRNFGKYVEQLKQTIG